MTVRPSELTVIRVVVRSQMSMRSDIITEGEKAKRQAKKEV